MDPPRQQTINETSEITTRGSGGATPLGTTLYASSPTAAIEIITTQPARLLRHNISDEQLEMLAATNRDGLSEAMWAMVGASIGLLSAAGEAIWRAYIETPPTPISVLHLLEIIGFVATFVASITIWGISINRGNRARAIVDAIRAQQEIHP
jgi:hypothetical protein